MSRFFYASSACIYPENRQLNTEIEGGGLKEEHAWPAQVRVLMTGFWLAIAPSINTNSKR